MKYVKINSLVKTIDFDTRTVYNEKELKIWREEMKNLEEIKEKSN